MVAVTPNPDAIRAFKSAAAFERWLRANHAKTTEIWIKIHKKSSGLPTITYADALDIALCWGWIDGLRKGYDDTSFIQRFTPRRARSLWSLVNTAKVEQLITDNRMQSPGLLQVEAAKADGRWARAYAGPGKMSMPEDIMAAINANDRALATFQTLSSQNRYALAFRLGNIKTAATRARRIAEYVAMLEQGQTIHPNSNAASKG